jgi:methylmalonyl-CoA mutase N-terminal domain/subunit
MSKPSNCGDSKENKLEPRNTASGIPVKVVYTPEDMKDIDYTKELNDPGKYPFTRGLYASGYREFAWGQRPVLGYGLPEDTNKRIKYLPKCGMVSPVGMPSYSITMDMPTAFGYDSDDPRIAQWVGLSGPPCNSIKDMEATIEGIPIEGVYAGILGYAPPWRLAHYVAMADNRGGRYRYTFSGGGRGSATGHTGSKSAGGQRGFSTPHAS